jgi:steroid delta-isomerase-like uncharacterized protein
MLEHDHPDCVNLFVALGEFRGREATRKLYDEIFTAFPDFELQVKRIVADDQVAAVQWAANGTFSGGAFQGIEPTGRRMELAGLDFMEVEDGLVRRNTIYYDGASFARSIGMLPQAESLGERALLAAFNAKTRLRLLVRRKRG